MQLRELPSVEALARRLAGGSELPQLLVVETVRQVIDEARLAIRQGESGFDPESVARNRLTSLGSMRPQRIINATGVLLHTNLGRAPLHPSATTASQIGSAYSNLELDLGDGSRGGRGKYGERLLVTLTGAEDALVVNNNAAALLLALAALASGREVIVSRGELIEIGGGFRLPEVMAASGAWLVEVGTTNRTHGDDYLRALTSSTAAILKVHTSNYQVVGFTEEVGLSQLVALARPVGVPVIADVGSGLLDTHPSWLASPPPAWLAREPGVHQALEAGAELVVFSGDKMLGGPQAGIVVGKQALVDRLRRHPMARAVRADAARLAGLAATLEVYAHGCALELPFWKMATLSYQELEARATKLLATSEVDGRIEEGASLVGAGSVPGQSLPSPVVVVEGGEVAFGRLLTMEPAVVARRQQGELVVDLRAVDPADDDLLATALRTACRS